MEDRKFTILSQNTLVPIGLIGGLMVLIVWFAGVSQNASQAIIGLAKVQQDLEQVKDKNNNLDIRLSVIDEKLSQIMSALKIKK
jgi:hypothetical protein